MGMLGVYMLADEETMSRLTKDEDFVEAIEEYGEEETTESYDIDKMWDGLHFLLTGVPAQEPIEGNPLSDAVAGTHVFDCEDFIAYSSPDDVARIVAALDEVDIEALVRDMDVVNFHKAEVYPDIWIKEYEELLRNELLTAFNELKAFYHRAKELNTGVLSSIY